MEKTIITSPSGNITAFVMDKTQRDSQKNIANAIMSKNKDIEQVGFFEKSNNSKAVAKLQMMGGEFCGNASRAFASVLYKNKFTKNKEFNISVSGINDLIKANITEINNNNFYSKITITKMNYQIMQSDIQEDRNYYDFVNMKGISHILVNENKYPFNKKNYLDRVKYLIDTLSMREKNAVGVIWYNKDNKNISIKPVVWVKNTDSYYYESACGSGSLALGLFLSQNKKEKSTYKIYQPSNDFIDIEINKKLNEVSIGGGVEIYDN